MLHTARNKSCMDSWDSGCWKPGIMLKIILTPSMHLVSMTLTRLKDGEQTRVLSFEDEGRLNDLRGYLDLLDHS